MFHCRILIADQSAPIREAIVAALMGEVSEFALASDGEEAWRVIQATDPDIVLAEDQLPLIDAFALCQKLRGREEFGETHFVVTSSDNERSTRIRAFESGADAVVSKPFHPGELLAQIRSMTRMIRFRQIAEQKDKIERAYQATIQGWVRALDLRDNENEGHSVRVADLSVQLGRRLGLSEEDLVQIHYGSLLHDIGKIGIPDSILKKAGTLDAEERLVIQRHPQYAFDMLCGIDYLAQAVSIPFSHHEKWDGTGYPLGLAGENIPIAARIFSVVDVYDALRSERPYKKAWSEDEALAELQRMSGTHFDPHVLEAFLEMMGAHTAAA